MHNRRELGGRAYINLAKMRAKVGERGVIGPLGVTGRDN